MNAKTVVLAFGVVLVLIGALGFFMNPVLGIFAVDMVHNLVHVVSGLFTFALAMKSEAGAKVFARIFGVVYGALAVSGLVISGDKIFGLLTANTADDILHAILAILFLFIGFSKVKSAPEVTAFPASPPVVPLQK